MTAGAAARAAAVLEIDLTGIVANGRSPHVRLTLSAPKGGEGVGKAILHIDAGMARLGLAASEFAALLQNTPPIAWRAVMSHLACADAPEHPLNERQRARFAEVIAQ